MNVGVIQIVTGGALGLVVLLARNSHHARRGGKDIYALARPIRLLCLGAPLLFFGFFAAGAFNSKGQAMDLQDGVLIGGTLLFFTLLPLYLALYRISADEKAVYYAAFFTSTIPFESITRIVEKEDKRHKVPYAYVYSRGRLLPMYVSGMLSDYDALMDTIRDKAPKTALES